MHTLNWNPYPKASRPHYAICARHVDMHARALYRYLIVILSQDLDLNRLVPVTLKGTVHPVLFHFKLKVKDIVESLCIFAGHTICPPLASC